MWSCVSAQRWRAGGRAQGSPLQTLALRRAWASSAAKGGEERKLVYFKTSEGVMVSPFRFARPEKLVKAGEKTIIPVKDIGDNTSTSDCLHLIRKQKQFVLFKGNIQNLNQLFSSVKKKMKERRDPSKLKTETLSTVFKVSLNRKLEESNILNRVLLGFRLSEPSACLSLGSYKEVPLVTKQLSGIYPEGTSPPSFGEDGEVVGVACGLNHYMGMRGASEWEKKGIAVRALGDQRIFPFYSVFAPTQQRYVQLLEEFIIKNGSVLKDGSVILDAGSGSGVLGILIASQAQKQLKKVSVVCSDVNPNAIDCIKHNAKSILGDKGSIRALCCDVYPPRSDKGQSNVEGKQSEKGDNGGEDVSLLKQNEDVGKEQNLDVNQSEGLNEEVVVDKNVEGLGEGEKGDEANSEEEDLLNTPLEEGNIHVVPKKKKKKLLKSKKTKLKSKTKKVATKPAEKEGVLEITQDKLMEDKYQLIVSNPPYLIIEDETLRNLDIGSYDVKGAFIKKLLSEANENLADDGKLLLIYSDLGANLGLQPADLIQNLCDQHNLHIEQTIRSSSNPPNEVPITLPEKVDHFKKHSDYLLMVITKKSLQV